MPKDMRKVIPEVIELIEGLLVVLVNGPLIL